MAYNGIIRDLPPYLNAIREQNGANLQRISQGRSFTPDNELWEQKIQFSPIENSTDEL